jgi:hypothetical protein
VVRVYTKFATFLKTLFEINWNNCSVVRMGFLLLGSEYIMIMPRNFHQKLLKDYSRTDDILFKRRIHDIVLHTKYNIVQRF